jgi:hypothetical protein
VLESVGVCFVYHPLDCPPAEVWFHRLQDGKVHALCVSHQRLNLLDAEPFKELAKVYHLHLYLALFAQVRLWIQLACLLRANAEAAADSVRVIPSHLGPAGSWTASRFDYVENIGDVCVMLPQKRSRIRQRFKHKKAVVPLQ